MWGCLVLAAAGGARGRAALVGCDVRGPFTAGVGERPFPSGWCQSCIAASMVRRRAGQVSAQLVWSLLGGPGCPRHRVRGTSPS